MPPDSLAIIQLTFLVRTDKYSPVTEKNSWKFAFQDYHESVKANNEQFDAENTAYANMFLRHFDERAEITDLSAKLITLTAYLEKLNIDYFIFSYAPMITSANTQELQNHLLGYELKKNTRVLDIYTDSLVQHMGTGNFYYDNDGTIPGQFGHLNATGAEQAFIVLDNLINFAN